MKVLKNFYKERKIIGFACGMVGAMFVSSAIGAAIASITKVANYLEGSKSEVVVINIEPTKH